MVVIITAKGAPIVANETTSDHITAFIDGTGTEWHLGQVGELFQLLHGGQGVHESSFIIELAERTHQQVISDGGSEDFHL